VASTIRDTLLRERSFADNSKFLLMSLIMPTEISFNVIVHYDRRCHARIIVIAVKWTLLSGPKLARKNEKEILLKVT
jgi:hypothetical protein